jgi:hypothetical protein
MLPPQIHVSFKHTLYIQFDTVGTTPLTSRLTGLISRYSSEDEIPRLVTPRTRFSIQMLELLTETSPPATQTTQCYLPTHEHPQRQIGKQIQGLDSAFGNGFERDISISEPASHSKMRGNALAKMVCGLVSCAEWTSALHRRSIEGPKLHSGYRQGG